MWKREKRFHPLWIAISAVALACVIVFSVLTAKSAGIAGRDSGLPVAVQTEHPIKLLAESEGYLAAADTDGNVVCYDKTTSAPLWQYAKRAAEGGNQARVNALAIRAGEVFVAFEDRSVCRFKAAGAGVPEGVIVTNYIPESLTFSSGSGTLFAVYGRTGAKREVYLLQTNFGGSVNQPASYRDYPKLDGGEYAVSSGGVETGVQGIYVDDQNVCVASDTYSVRRFTQNGMKDGYEEFTLEAEKLAAFAAHEEGFAGVDLRGNYYRLDASFQTLVRKSLGAEFTAVKRAGSSFYGVNAGGVVGASMQGEKLFSLSEKGSLAFVSENAFALASGSGVKYYEVGFAASIERWANKTPVFAVMIGAFALLLLYSALAIFRPVRKRMNGAFVRAGKIFVKHKFAYLGLIPAFALLAVFYYWPIVQGFALSFFNYNGVTKVFVGFQNFADVLHNTVFWGSMGNMFVFLITDILKALIPPFFFAEFILAVRNKKFSFAVRVLLFIPGILPGVAGTLVWVNGIFGGDSYGLLNSICSIFIPNFVQTWIGPYLETRSLMSLLMFGFPWVGSYLIFYGGIMAIPSSLLEAAELDGCGWWRRIFTIDLRLILSQIKYIFITSFIASVQDYGRLFITDQSTGHGLKIPSLLIYEYIYQGGSEPNYGLSSAMSLFLFAFLLAVTILNFRKQKEEVL